jgi:hypothetical protein
MEMLLSMRFYAPQDSTAAEELQEKGNRRACRCLGSLPPDLLDKYAGIVHNFK